MSKISAYSPITEVQSDDLLVVVDVNDTSMAPTGTDKKMTLGQLYGNLAPWQFTPETYGALGDGKIIGDATIAGGALSTLTSASAAFTSADTGKHIMINGAGTGGNKHPPLITTITYVNATTVTLAAAASGAVTNASAIYGTDDTAAINSAVTAAGTYAMGAGGNFHAQVIFRNSFYCLATSPAITGTWGSTPSFYAQIPLPYPNANGTTQKLILDFLGVGAADDDMYWLSTIPSIQGSCLVAMALPSNGSNSQQYPSVIGGPVSAAGFSGGSNPGFANTKLYVDGLTVVTPWGSAFQGYDLRLLAGAGGGTFSAKQFGAVNGNYNNLGDLPAFYTSSGTALGLWMPRWGNNDDCTVTSFTCQGFTFGVNIADHATFLRLACIYCYYGIQVYYAGSGGGAWHGGAINYYSCEASEVALAGPGTGPTPIRIGLIDCEFVTLNHVYDPLGHLTGDVHVFDTGGTTLNVNGASNLKITNDTRGPGVWSGAPSVPATTVAQQNTAWRDATVYITSGGAAVSEIDVDGSPTGLTLGTSGSVTIRVPAGHFTTLTYASTAPTWVWVLD